MFLQEVCLLTWCCSCAAAFTIVLVSWARGGQLGRRGRGYQVRPALLEQPVLVLTLHTPLHTVHLVSQAFRRMQCQRPGLAMMTGCEKYMQQLLALQCGCQSLSMSAGWVALADLYCLTA